MQPESNARLDIIDGWIEGRKDKRTGGLTGGRAGGRAGRQAEGQISIPKHRRRDGLTFSKCQSENAFELSCRILSLYGFPTLVSST